jgi:hypothetical protein
MSIVVVGTIRSNSTSPPTIQDTSGTEIGTFCRAWVNFNGTTNVGGFCTIRASFNVTSVADVATGVYTVNFTNALPDANYSWSGLAGSPGVTNGLQILNTANASNVSIATVNTAFSVTDFNTITVMVFR